MSNLGHISETVLCSRGVLLLRCQLFLPLIQLLLEYGHWVSFLCGLEIQTYTEETSSPSNQVPERSRQNPVMSGTDESSSTYHVPSVLNDASFLRQDLDEPMSLSFTEHHATHRGDQSLEGQMQRCINRIFCCCCCKGRKLLHYLDIIHMRFNKPK